MANRKSKAKSHKQKMDIKGLDWKIQLHTPEEYEQLHGKDSEGMTVMESQVIDLNQEHLGLPVILHELGHAYFHSCLTRSADLSQEDIEEIFCEILSYHTEEILSRAKQLLIYFKNQ